MLIQVSTVCPQNWPTIHHPPIYFGMGSSFRWFAWLVQHFLVQCARKNRMPTSRHFNCFDVPLRLPQCQATFQSKGQQRVGFMWRPLWGIPMVHIKLAASALNAFVSASCPWPCPCPVPLPLPHPVPHPFHFPGCHQLRFTHSLTSLHFGSWSWLIRMQRRCAKWRAARATPEKGAWKE